MSILSNGKYYLQKLTYHYLSQKNDMHKPSLYSYHRTDVVCHAVLLSLYSYLIHFYVQIDLHFPNLTSLYSMKDY